MPPFSRTNTRSKSHNAPSPTPELAGSIITSNGNILRCSVRDVTSNGAVLYVATVLGVPDEFILQVAGMFRTKVRVILRSSGKVTVAFR